MIKHRRTPCHPKVTLQPVRAAFYSSPWPSGSPRGWPRPGPAWLYPIQSKSCDATGKDKGLNTCADSPGHIIVCTSGGDYMCCKVTPTGKECEEIVKDSEASVIGKLKGNQLQLTPTTPGPKTSPLQKGGMNAPIMRRGVEGAPAEMRQPILPAGRPTRSSPALRNRKSYANWRG